MTSLLKYFTKLRLYKVMALQNYVDSSMSIIEMILDIMVSIATDVHVLLDL